MKTLADNLETHNFVWNSHSTELCKLPEGETCISLFEASVDDEANGSDSPEKVFVRAGSQKNSPSSSSSMLRLLLHQDRHIPSLSRVHGNRHKLAQAGVQTLALTKQELTGQINLLVK